MPESNEVSVREMVKILKLGAWRMESFMENWAEPQGSKGENDFYKAANRLVHELLTVANKYEFANKETEEMWHNLLGGYYAGD